MPITALVDEAPVYDRPAARPAYLDDPKVMSADTLPESRDLVADLLDLLARPTIASKAWVYRQYDSMVRASTVLRPEATPQSSRCLAHHGFERGIAMTTDGNGRYVYLDPRAGGMHAVAEAARNLTCAGARPLAVTDCLNFGNPEKPGIFYQFVESVTGIAEACRALDTPSGQRQRQLLQRDRRARHLPHANHRHGGRRGRPRPYDHHRAERARATCSCSLARQPRRLAAASLPACALAGRSGPPRRST